MNVTRNIIHDLLPAYFSGEASDDTRALVEEFFSHNPEFERSAREQARSLESLATEGAPPPDAAGEKHALHRVRGILRWQRVLFGLALTFTLNAILIGFSFEISVTDKGEVTHVHWMRFAFQRNVVLVLAGLALLSWVFYWLRAARSRT